MKEYPEAGHSFLNDHAGQHDKVPIYFVVFGKLLMKSGLPAPTTRQDARRRIVAFFDDHLRGPVAT